MLPAKGVAVSPPPVGIHSPGPCGWLGQTAFAQTALNEVEGPDVRVPPVDDPQKADIRFKGNRGVYQYGV